MKARSLWLFTLLVLVGCRSDPSSQIVRQVELAGSGDIAKVPAETLLRFFDVHARLAVRIEALCLGKRLPNDVAWMVSNEGKVCQAVATRDRVKYLETLETMKRMDMDHGDQGAAISIEKAEGK